MRLLIFSAVLSIVSLLPSCMEPDDALVLTDEKGVWIVNEGVFNSGNGGIGFLDEQYQYHQDLFEPTNGYRAGDVVQDLLRHGKYLFMVVNNSGKIERLQANDLRSEAVNSGFLSPRKICIWDDTSAFVSELYKDVIYRIDPMSLSIKEEIPCVGWTEGMVKAGNKLWIVNVERRKLLSYSPQFRQFTDSLDLPASPGDILIDKEEKIWIYCGGIAGGNAHLMRINPNDGKVLTDLISNPVKEYVPKMCINQAGDQLYVLHSGVFVVPIEAGSMPLSRLISAGKHAYYGIGINNRNGDILISQIEDFASPSKILVFDQKGLQKALPVSAGMITSGFVER
jgi:streptogramin lyase